MKMPPLTTLLSVCGVAALLCSPVPSAHAALVAYDGFDGTTLTNGGTGWTTVDWTAGLNPGANLTYGGLTTAGTGALVAPYWEGESTRRFPAQTTGTVWFSWIQNSNGTTAGNPNQVRLMDGAFWQIFIGQHFDGNTFKIYHSDHVMGANSGRPITGTHFIVVSVDLAQKIVNLYVNPRGIGGSAPTTPPNATFDGEGSITKLDRVRIVGGGDILGVDEFRVGTSWADVSPGTGDPALTTAPTAPSDLQATSNSFSEITLTWTDNSTDEDNFELERSLNGVSGWESAAAPALNTATFQDTGLTATTSYFYRIKATNAGGSSAYSAITSATTSALPAAVALTPIYLPFADEDGSNASLITPVPGFIAFSDPGFVEASSALSYPGVLSSGNGFTIAPNSRMWMTLDTTLPGLQRYVSGGRIGGSGLGAPHVAPLYVSWMVRGLNPQEANTVEFSTRSHGDAVTLAVGTTFGNDFIRLIAAGALEGGANRYVSTTIPASPSTTFYVAKFVFGPNDTSTVSLYINQLTEGTPDAVNTGFLQFNTIGFAKYGDAAVPSIDEFRIGTSWVDVGGTASAPLSAIQSWFSSFSLPTTGTGTGSYTADNDGDGAVNLLEYAFAANPIINDGGKLPVMGKVNVSGIEYLSLTFVRRTGASSGITYTPQSSSDLADWSGVPVQVGTAANNGDGTETVTFRDTVSISSTAKRFLRVRVATTAL